MTLNQKVQVLDEGYVQLIDTWGSDQRIVEAARMSTDKGFLGWGESPCTECGGSGNGPDQIDGPGDVYQNKCGRCAGKGQTIGDEKLLAYLWKNAHQTPFEMAGLTIEVQAPIFVFREWHRHRVPFGYNELSARYTPMPNLNYVPEGMNLLQRAEAALVSANKQARGATDLASINKSQLTHWLELLQIHYDLAEELYQYGLQVGVPKELARLPVPVGRFSRMRATGNLRGWLAFLKLRYASTAQQEIRDYAGVVNQLIQQVFPRTHAVVTG